MHPLHIWHVLQIQKPDMLFWYSDDAICDLWFCCSDTWSRKKNNFWSTTAASCVTAKPLPLLFSRRLCGPFTAVLVKLTKVLQKIHHNVTPRSFCSHVFWCSVNKVARTVRERYSPGWGALGTWTPELSFITSVVNSWWERWSASNMNHVDQAYVCNLWLFPTSLSLSPTHTHTHTQTQSSCRGIS